jgi:predicted lipoprotein with Yx(FWY)xxD motif
MDECADVRAELGVYVLGAITPADRAKVVRHLTACRRCRNEVAGLAVLPGLLRKLPAAIAAQLTAEGTLPDDPGLEAGLVNGLPDGLIRRVARRRLRQRWLTAAAVAVLAATAGAGWAQWLSLSSAGRPATVLALARVGSESILVNTDGFTVYWFDRDTVTTSACTGRCTWQWPPVTGPAAAGPGVPGQLGSITRPDGTIQATYDGHPLYTAYLDIAPGQARGNNLDASGGRWHEVTVPGLAPSPASPSSSPATGGAGGPGYGY